MLLSEFTFPVLSQLLILLNCKWNDQESLRYYHGNALLSSMQNLEHFTAANLGFGAVFAAGGEAQSTNKCIIETAFFYFFSKWIFLWGKSNVTHIAFIKQIFRLRRNPSFWLRQNSNCPREETSRCDADLIENWSCHSWIIPKYFPPAFT